jgi:hypothetical protein
VCYLTVGSLWYSAGEGIVQATNVKAYELIEPEFVLSNGIDWKCPRIFMLFQAKGVSETGCVVVLCFCC